jgi:hypothetical protein
MGPIGRDSAAEVSRLWQDEAAQSDALCALARSLEKRGTFSFDELAGAVSDPGGVIDRASHRPVHPFAQIGLA